MLDIALAEKFVKKATNYTQYNINIMNENGSIIASSDPDRVGSFHEVAYKIMNSDKDIIEVVSEDQFQGGRTGINIALFYKRKKVGVVGITGEPEKIRDTAFIIKMAMETMLEYEIQEKRNSHQQNLKMRFMDRLLYQEEADSEGELTAVSEQLGYDPQLSRIPVLIVFERQTDPYKLLELLRNQNILSLQDIVSVTRDNGIIIYKSIPSGKEIYYRDILEEMQEKLELFFCRQNAACRYYMGSLQKEYRYYRKSYQHCLWMKKYFRNSKEHIFWFYEYIGEYMQEVVPMIELNRIFADLSEWLDEDLKNSMIEMVETLHRNNYNLNTSSKELFIHKNTLIFRYNKIKNLFHINPIQHMADREFLRWFVLYLKKNR